MSLKLFFGLLLQVIAILMIMKRVRRHKLAYTGVLFVWVSVIYHGLTELTQLAFPGMNFFRRLVSQDNIDGWVLIVGLAILLFAVAYCYRVRPYYKQENVKKPVPELSLVNWRWGMLIVILLYLMNVGVLGHFEVLGYWGGGLITYILPFFTILVYLKLFYKMDGKYFIPIFFFIVALGVLSGQRSAIVFDLVVLLCVLVRYDVPIRWKALILPATIAILLVVSISCMRYVVGRTAFGNQTAQERIKSLSAGVKTIFQYGLPRQILQDYVYRFDGNSFGGLVLAGYGKGIEPAGWTPILNNFQLAVPHFMNPIKLDIGLLNLNEEDYLIDHFKISGFRIDRFGKSISSLIDYIPGIWGVLFGAFGTAGVLLIAVLMGWGFAVADNWIMRSKTFLAVLIGIGLTYATVWMEQGFRVYVLTGRAVLALFLVLVMFRMGKAILAGSRRRKSSTSSALFGKVNK